MDLPILAFTLFLVYSLQYPTDVKSVSDDDYRTVVDSEQFNFIAFIGSKQYVPLKKSKYHITCLGVVITKKHVLSVYQCMKDTEKHKGKAEIFAGSREIYKCESYAIDRIITYNYWVEQNSRIPVFDYQNAVIIKVTREFDEKKIMPVFVPKRKDEFYGTPVTSVRFSARIRGLTATSELQVTNLKLMSKNSCATKLTEPSDADGILFCSMSPPKMTGKDSGSPILYEKNTLAGINIAVAQGYSKYRQENLHLNFKFLRDFVESQIGGELLLVK
ncbi:hypothetical protein QAD02_011204 [Eretmocerus hayati]|uniref:Uncharacterized protein n=1 Tax=Eretmocerus hayati TaxID=131215 RepID=A0ACC2NX38_9HYME|nr:hypothetical protein QAD02_011204 [Eretmocerus hayati]